LRTGHGLHYHTNQYKNYLVYFLFPLSLYTIPLHIVCTNLGRITIVSICFEKVCSLLYGKVSDWQLEQIKSSSKHSYLYYIYKNIRINWNTIQLSILLFLSCFHKTSSKSLSKQFYLRFEYTLQEQHALDGWFSLSLMDILGISIWYHAFDDDNKHKTRINKIIFASLMI